MILQSSLYIKNFFWLSLDFISKGLIVAFSNYFIFNSIDKGEYGKISIVSNLIIVLYTIFSLGSNFTYLKRFTSKSTNEEFNEEFSYALSYRILISILTFLILTFLYLFNLINIVTFILFISLCFELLIVYNEITLAKNKNQYKTFANFFSDLSYFILIYYLYKSNSLNIINLAICLSLRTFLRTLIFISFGYFNLKLKYNIRFNLNYIKELFTESYPLIFSTVSNIYLIVVIQLLIDSFLGKDDLGIFSAGYYLVNLCMVFFTVFSNSLNKYTFNNVNNEGKNSRIIFTIFYLTLLLLLLNYLFGIKLLQLFFSKNFIDSIEIFFNFYPYILLISFKPILDKLLVYNGQRHILAIRNVFSLIFTTIITIYILYFNFNITIIPFVFFLSELFVMIYYFFNSETKYLFHEIRNGILRFVLK